MIYLNYKFHYRWWCHFDDDNYVHVEQLVNLLEQYSPSEPYYLGKTSTAKPLEIFHENAAFPVSTRFLYFSKLKNIRKVYIQEELFILILSF